MSLLASALKLFFRELPDPLITRETRDSLYGCACERDADKLVAKIRKAIAGGMRDPMAREVLK